ncbi:cation diffusion facilitator family transporter [Lachnoclostridium phytofermentans]|uniref:Cation diffusion facilitator family transporter n=1 Tax=Lachnoclostridium phytofermentans (strain ATCC 700394 / DSM 18823 / ISDg) TaxID=357809 RepID=A9KIR9_LACP7|nr:cation diffusion facilitator family transporter [Lachnoclostridium phytofermentans]ABX43932.1 cation diffusion facilitator family transporter [Lachnoclostridium phytofermentans ISDg]
MTNLLVKLFVKNSEEVHEQKVRTSYGILASIVGVISNLILFLCKFTIGLLINSISVTADAFNNLSDSASSLISLVGVKLASKPADKEHPFGHGRYEYISALIVAFLVLQVGFTCFKSSVNKILHPESTKFAIVSIIILMLSIFLKVWLALFNRKLGKRINSTVMKATAADALGDVLITSATVLSLIIGHLTGLKVDGYMGAAVSIFVLIAGFNIAKDTLEPLIGQAINPKLYKMIVKKVMEYPYIIGTHDLVAHNYGPSHTMATIHCEVPNDISMEDAHEVIDRIERDMLRDENIFLVIHMDPVEVNNVKIKEIRAKVIKKVKELEKKASIHDFRVVNGENQINLIFDLVLPHHYKPNEEEEFLLDLQDRIKEIDERYQCVITIENSFIAED